MFQQYLMLHQFGCSNTYITTAKIILTCIKASGNFSLVFDLFIDCIYEGARR